MGSNSGNSESGLSKWQIAALIGVPVAAIAVTSACVYLWRRSRAQEVEESAGTQGRPPAENHPTGAGGTDDKVIPGKTQGVEETKTPLQEARDVKTRGNNLFKEKKFEEAIVCYEEAIQLCPDDQPDDLATFNHNLAACYENMAKNEEDPSKKKALWTKVEERCTQAVMLKKSYVKAFSRRARARVAVEKFRDALLDVTRVLLMDETQGGSFAELMPNLLKSLGRELATENYPKLPPLEPPNHLVQSFVDDFTWKVDLSKQRLWSLWESAHPSQSSHSNPTLPATPDKSGSGKDQSDDNDQSDDKKEAGVDEATEDQPQQAEADQARRSPVVNGYPDEEQNGATASSEDLFKKEPFVEAASRFRKGMFTGLLVLLTEALNTGDPVFHPYIYLLRGNMHAMWRMGEKALKDYQTVLDTEGLSQSMYADALVKKAIVLACNGREAESEAEFKKAIEVKKDHADIYLQRGRLLMEAEDISQFDRAKDDFTLALQLFPDSAQALYSLGSVYLRIGAVTQSLSSISDAKNKFEEAYQKHPNYVEGLIIYAMFLRDTQRVAEAKDILHKVLKLEPDNAAAHFSLSIVYLVEDSDSDKASKSLETAIAMDSSCLHAYEALASVELQRGNTTRAFELYDTAIKNVRSINEMQQAYITREMLAAQEAVCRELNINPTELVNQRLAAQ